MQCFNELRSNLFISAFNHKVVMNSEFPSEELQADSKISSNRI